MCLANGTRIVQSLSPATPHICTAAAWRRGGRHSGRLLRHLSVYSTSGVPITEVLFTSGNAGGREQQPSSGKHVHKATPYHTPTILLLHTHALMLSASPGSPCYVTATSRADTKALWTRNMSLHSRS
ncbi:cyclin-A1 [Platysternon megacephalum]|uniref:Cyclin-A1 n=1 Tax=Platysternon megacephalum TaxID=55544 RepID=A0A4D9EL61_9SAUR|nr:cyclin-A1 [Platysternon megacephalum]